MEHHRNNHHHHHNATSSSNSNGPNTSSPSPTPSPRSNPTVTRSDPSSPYPTTFVQADTSSFKQVVQLLTGSSDPKPNPNPNPNPKPNPHLRPNPKSRPNTKLYERRNNSFKHHLTLLPTPAGHPPHHQHQHQHHYPLSPSILDFPSLMLSPVTPLIHDPFTRSSPGCSPIDKIAEDKAIAEKNFFLHPVSPVSVTTEQPRLLPLFPLTSPKVSSSMN